MFPDNAIAEQFSLGRNKSTYVVINGLSPYLKELLTENIYLSNCFLIYFAECFSSVIQSYELDIVTGIHKPRMPEFVTEARSLSAVPLINIC